MIELAEYYYTLRGSIYEVEWQSRDIGFLGSRSSCTTLYQENGEFVAEVLSPDGETIYLGYFSLKETRPPLDWEGPYDNDPLYTYAICLPARDNIGEIQLKNVETSKIMYRYQFDSDKTMDISFINNIPQILDEPFKLEWNFLGEKDQITYEVFYSNKNGDPGTWRGLAEINPPVTTMTLRSTFLKASEERSAIRVFATDGVNYSYATSNPFWVGETPPVIESHPASTPIGEIVIAQGRSVNKSWYVKLRGVDAEGIPSENIAWYSDKDGFVARGRRYYANNLSPGDHKLHVVVTGANGTIYPDHHVSYVTVIAEPEIKLSQGDGTGDLACNEIEISVDLNGAELRYFFYGFNMLPDQKFIVSSNVTELPFRYQMNGDTRVRFEVATMMDDGAKFSKLVQAMDCESQ